MRKTDVHLDVVWVGCGVQNASVCTFAVFLNTLIVRL